MPTEKRMKYLAKQAAKLAQLRSQHERDEQIKVFIMQMNEYNIPFGDPDIQNLLRLFREYVLVGGCHNGKLLIRDIDSYAYYRLFEDKRFHCEVDIKKRVVEKKKNTNLE